MLTSEERALIFDKLKEGQAEDSEILQGVAKLQEDFDEFADKLIQHETLEMDHKRLQDEMIVLSDEHENLKEQYRTRLLETPKAPDPVPPKEEKDLTFESLFK